MTFFQMIGLVREDWRMHGRDWTLPGFQAVAIHRFGVWRMTLRWKLLRAPFSVVYRFAFRFVRNFYGIEIPYSCRIGRRLVVEHQGGIVVHGNTVIGDDCRIRQGVTLGNRHLARPLEAPRLGDGVEIGAGAQVLGAVVVGRRARIGANAVVLEDVPPHRLVVGIPARVVDPIPRALKPEPHASLTAR